MRGNVSSDDTQKSRRVALFALIMAFGTLGSRVLGLVRDIALAALFSRYITDAWIAAFRLPNLFRRLLGEGSLGAGFIPIFVSAWRADGNRRGERSDELLNGVYTLLFSVLAFLTALGAIFAEPVLSVILGGDAYMSVPGKFELTVQMARIMFGFLFFISQFAYFMAILNALDRYAMASIAPCLFNIAMIAAAFVPMDWQSYQGQALAWGVILGGALQALFLVPSLIQLGVLPKIRFHFSADVLRVVKNMLPVMAGMGVLQITSLVNVYFASELPQGSHSWLYWADRILELPLSLFAVSLGSALLPTLSRFWSEKNYEGMTKTATYHLRLIGFVSVPACVGMYFLALPIVDVIYRRGKFDMDDALMTASILQVYALMLVIASGVRVITPAFHAIQNTWYPAVVSVGSLIFHVLIARALMEQYGVVGLALSSLFSGLMNLGLLSIGFRYWIGSLEFVSLIRSFLKYGLASLGMYICFPLHDWLYSIMGVPRALSLTVTIAVASLVYFMICALLRSEEYFHTVGHVTMKLKGRLTKAAKK